MITGILKFYCGFYGINFLEPNFQQGENQIHVSDDDFIIWIHRDNYKGRY